MRRPRSARVHPLLGLALLALALVGLLGLGTNAGAASALLVGAADLTERGLDLLPHAEVLRDPTARRSLPEIVAAAAQPGADGFEPLDGPLMAGFTRDVFWLRLVLARAPDAPGEVYLVTWPSFIDHVDLYLPRPDGGWRIMRAGDHVPVARRALAVRATVFPLTLPTTPQAVYLRVQSRSALILSARLFTPTGFAAYAMRADLLHGLALGLAAMAFLVSALAAWWLRQRVYVLAAAYLLLFGLLQVVIQGTDQLLVYPHAPWRADHVLGALSAATAALMLWFILSYLAPAGRYRLLTTLLWGLAAGNAAIAVAAMLGLYPLLARWFYLLMLPSLALSFMLILSLLADPTRRRRALAILLLFLIPGLGVMLVLLRNLGLLVLPLDLVDPWVFITLLQAPFAALVLLLRVRDEQRRLGVEESYRVLIENQVDLVVKVDLQGHFLYVSPSYCRLFGRTREDLLGQPFMPLVHADDLPATTAAFERVCQPPHYSYVEQRARTATGWRWLAWSATGVLDAQGQVSAIVGVARDITDRKDAEQALARSRRLLELALIGGQIGFYHAEVASNTILGDERCLAILGYQPGELTLDWPTWQALLHPDDRARATEVTEEMLQDRLECLEIEYRMRHRAGHWVWILDRGGVFERDAQGRPQRLAGTFQDITRLKEAEARLAYLVDHDELTGLLNRRGIARSWQHLQAQSQRAGRPFALAICDLDHFKRINDHYGHGIGDQVLCRVSAALREQLREGDWLGRWGGEEFLVILPESTLAQAEVGMERVREAIAALELEVGGHRLHITLSIGVAAIEGPEDSSDRLLTRADRALYRAKHGGRNRICRDGDGEDLVLIDSSLPV